LTKLNSTTQTTVQRSDVFLGSLNALFLVVMYTRFYVNHVRFLNPPLKLTFFKYFEHKCFKFVCISLIETRTIVRKNFRFY